MKFYLEFKYFPKTVFEHVVCEMVAILFRGDELTFSNVLFFPHISSVTFSQDQMRWQIYSLTVLIISAAELFEFAPGRFSTTYRVIGAA